MCKVRTIGLEVKKNMYESIVVPTVMYGSETWSMGVKERKRLDVMEMKCLRSMCGISIRDRVRNEVIRKKVRVNEKLSERIDKRVLTWFGHVERMNDCRLTKRVYKSIVSGARPRGRPRLG